jgi:hypothetical protein
MADISAPFRPIATAMNLRRSKNLFSTSGFHWIERHELPGAVTGKILSGYAPKVIACKAGYAHESHLVITTLGEPRKTANAPRN